MLRPALLACWKYRPAPCSAGPGARKDTGTAGVAVVLSLSAPEVRQPAESGLVERFQLLNLLLVAAAQCALFRQIPRRCHCCCCRCYSSPGSVAIDEVPALARAGRTAESAGPRVPERRAGSCVLVLVILFLNNDDNESNCSDNGPDYLSLGTGSQSGCVCSLHVPPQNHSSGAWGLPPTEVVP